ITMLLRANEARVLTAGNRGGAKVILVGDSQQLQPIEPGAAFRVVTEEIGAADILTVVRQRHEWMRVATEGFASGEPAQAEAALSAYADHGLIQAGIGGGFDEGQLIAEAEQALGTALGREDRVRAQLVASYLTARAEAGGLWGEIEHGGAPYDKHPYYERYAAAAGRRAESGLAILDDLEGVRPWLARYGVDLNGLAADTLVTQGIRRADVEERAAAFADQLGITDTIPDVSLRVDWRAGARAELINAWAEGLVAEPTKSSLILSYTREDVRRLNIDARTVMREQRRLLGGDVEITDAEGRPLALAVGDRILCLRNSGPVLRNGLFGTILAILPAEQGGGHILKIKLDGVESPVDIDTSDYPDLALGYAATVHKSQGTTVDLTYVLGHSRFDRHLFYVAMSRHRESARLFASATDFRGTASLVHSARLARSADAIGDFVDPLIVAEGGIEPPESRLAYFLARQDADSRESVPERAMEKSPAAAAVAGSKSGAGDGAPVPVPTGNGPALQEQPIPLTEKVNIMFGIAKTPSSDRTVEQETQLREFIKNLQQTAEAGDRESQVILGSFIEIGIGLSGVSNTSEAAGFYAKAADQSDPRAQYKLGKMYENGEGVEQDLVKAVQLYYSAAQQGFSPASNALGRLFEAGEGIKADFSRAQDWYRCAVAQGKEFEVAGEAIGDIAKVSLSGDGPCIRMPELAEVWSKIAANNESRWLKESVPMTGSADLISEMTANARTIFVKYVGAGITDYGDSIEFNGVLTWFRALTLIEAVVAHGWRRVVFKGIDSARQLMTEAAMHYGVVVDMQAPASLIELNGHEGSPPPVGQRQHQQVQPAFVPEAADADHDEEYDDDHQM
ncbi:MAG: AAA family ATPase, partial [Rhodospirillaceae bacterium]